MPLGVPTLLERVGSLLGSGTGADVVERLAERVLGGVRRRTRAALRGARRGPRCRTLRAPPRARARPRRPASSGPACVSSTSGGVSCHCALSSGSTHHGGETFEVGVRRPQHPGQQRRGTPHAAPPRPPARPGGGSATARRAARSATVVEQVAPARPARPSRRRSRGGTSTRRRTGRRSRRRTARRRAGRRARSRPSAPSRARAAGGTPSRIWPSIQPDGRRGSAQASITSANAVSTRISNRRTDWRSDRETRSSSRPQHPAAYRAEPRHRRPRRPPTGIGNSPRRYAASSVPGSRSAPVATRSSSRVEPRRTAGTPRRSGAARSARSPTLGISGRHGSERRIGTRTATTVGRARQPAPG